MRTIFLILTFTLPASAVFAEAPDACDAVFAGLSGIDLQRAVRKATRKELRNLSEGLYEAFDEYKQLNPDLVAGKALPAWKDFDQIENLTRKIRTEKIALQAKGDWKKVESLFPRLTKIAKEDPDLTKLAAAGTGMKAIPVTTYNPTEYELKRLYQHKLWELNKELPSSLRINGSRIPFDKRRAVLVDQARALVSKQVEEIEKLNSTSVFNDHDAYIAALKAESPEMASNLKIIQEENIDFAIRRPQNGRWWIPKVGFQNQRTTGSSKGTFDHYARDQTEFYETFGNMARSVDNDLKPKYGYLRSTSAQETALTSGGATHYGDDIFILKKETLRDRTTWTIGDSLGRGMGASDSDKPKFWMNAFTPWKQRDLIVPYVQGSLAGSDSVALLSDIRKKPDLQKYLVYPPDVRYVEMQYWGPVTLDDVASFQFTKTPPTGEFLQELQKRAIKILDCSKEKCMDWVPSIIAHPPP